MLHWKKTSGWRKTGGRVDQLAQRTETREPGCGRRLLRGR
jgi:hypothetical protein